MAACYAQIIIQKQHSWWDLCFLSPRKLGKLVSSSFPITIFPSASSSPSPSFRSHHNFTTTSTSTNTNPSSALSNTQNECHHHNHSFKISKIPYFLTHKKKKTKDSSSENHNNNAMIFKRSKSTVIPRKGMHFNEFEDFSAHKKRFFSFRHFNKQLVGKKVPEMKQISYSSSSHSTNMGLSSTYRERSLKKENVVVVEENESHREGKSRTRLRPRVRDHWNRRCFSAPPLFSSTIVTHNTIHISSLDSHYNR